MPCASKPRYAEYFSSATWSDGMRAANDGLASDGLAMGGASDGREPWGPERAGGFHGDAARLAVDRELELRFEADAGEAEAAAGGAGVLAHHLHVVGERVGLAVHPIDPLAQQLEVLVAAAVRDADRDGVRLAAHLEHELDAVAVRVRQRVLHELVDGERDLRLAVLARAGAGAERLGEPADLVDEDPRRAHPDEELHREVADRADFTRAHSC